MTSTFPLMARRSLLAAGVLGGAGLALSACSGGTSGNGAAEATAGATAGASTDQTGGASVPAASAGPASVPTLEELTPLAASFAQSSYTDPQTGLTLPFNVFLPQGYDTTVTYPLVHYIADSSQVSTEVTTPLSQYGALIWAHSVTQDTDPCVVVVPCYPETVLDDHDGYTTTDWLGVTERFLPWLQQEYAIDPQRVYGTGQSMGCMIHLILAATDPDLLTACLFIDGQWDAGQLTGLGQGRWIYHVAGGDDRALTGQNELRAMLDAQGVDYATAPEEWDATASDEVLEAQVAALTSQGAERNFSQFVAGTVTQVNPQGMEHMASFEPAYKLTGLRTWLLAQRG